MPILEKIIIICRRADVVWPPWNCDLTPLDYYLWAVVKDKCYADKPEIIDTLKDNIHTIDHVLKNSCRLLDGQPS